MAYAVEVTIGTGNKVSLNYQSQEVGVSLTYKLEREDTDVLAIVQDKADELVRAHVLACKRVKEEEKPAPQKEEEAHAVTAPLPEEPHLEGVGATAAQLQLLRSLGRQAGLDEDRLKKRTRESYGHVAPEDLSHDQAAWLIVELGREERKRFEQERTRSAPNQPDEETATDLSP